MGTNRRLAVVFFSLAFVGAACESGLTEVQLEHSKTRHRSGRHDNSDRGNGGHRSGTAELSALALLGADGKTRLDLVSNGSIKAVSVKAPDRGKKKNLGEFEHLSGSHVVLELKGLARGERLEIKAEVKVPGGRRTGVVTVTTTVLLAPDLAVHSLMTPSTIFTGQQTVVTAQVSEGNLDTGATANCVLYVAGVAVDQATGIVVAAGETVNCAFSHLFTAAGPTTVEVRATGVNPGDYDTANNSASVVVNVMNPGPTALPFDYSASISDLWFDDRTETIGTVTFDDGSRKEFTRTTSNVGRNQVATLSATRADTLAFPVGSLTIGERSDGASQKALSFGSIAVETSDVFDTGAVTFTTDCGGATDAGENAFVMVCRSLQIENGSNAILSSFTSIDYSRFATAVVYHSEEFGQVFDPGGTGSDYSVGDDVATNAGIFGAVGAAYAIELTVIDGARTLGATANITTGVVDVSSVAGPFCEDFSDDTSSTHQCTTIDSTVTGREGFASSF